MKWTYVYDTTDYNDELYLYQHPELESLQTGDRVLAASRTNLMSGTTTYHLYPQYAETGYPGNTDHSVRRFHGWRGTTNDIYVEALGVYAVKSASHDNGKLRIVLGKTDLKRKED